MHRLENFEQNDSRFYLYFIEGFHDEQPRLCTRIRKVSFGSGSKIAALLVRITPPCSGEKYGLEGRQIDLLLLSAVFAGQSFFPIEKLPMPVHIYLPVSEASEMRDHIDLAETKNIALGEIRQAPDVGR